MHTFYYSELNQIVEKSTIWHCNRIKYKWHTHTNRANNIAIELVRNGYQDINTSLSMILNHNAHHCPIHLLRRLLHAMVQCGAFIDSRYDCTSFERETMNSDWQCMDIYLYKVISPEFLEFWCSQPSCK